MKEGGSGVGEPIVAKYLWKRGGVPSEGKTREISFKKTGGGLQNLGGGFDVGLVGTPKNPPQRGEKEL